MTPFEKARIRLKAFALLEGWGLTERMARAEELTKWAIGENHDEQRQWSQADP